MRVALIVSTAAAVALALLSGTAASASEPGGYAVSRIALPSPGFGIAVDPSSGVIYVGGEGTTAGSGTVTVINSVTQAVADTVAVPGLPMQIAVDPATGVVYAATGNGLSVIDGATDEVITTIPSVDGYSVAVDPVTNMVYAVTSLAGGISKVAVIDGATNAVTATVAHAGASVIESLAVDTATDTIYAGASDGSLTAINGATNARTTSVRLDTSGSSVSSVAVDPGTSTVYGVLEGDSTVDAVNAATLAPVASIPCPGDNSATADPAANAVFVTGSRFPSPPVNSTCVIGTATNTVIGAFPRSGLAVAADTATGAAYITSAFPRGNVWVATPSPTDQLSPVTYGFVPPPFSTPNAAFPESGYGSWPLQISALPAATVTETGALPTGITMSSAGVFSGTPAAGTVGTYPITVTAANGISPDSTLAVTIYVYVTPAIIAPTTATFQTGASGRFTVDATGNPAPTVQASGYPSWLTFTPPDSSDVVFAGTPPPGSGGAYQADVWATNAFATSPTQTVTIIVDQPPGIAAARHLTFRSGHHVRYKVTATGYPVPVLRERGSPPPGLEFRASRGVAYIVGTPARRDDGKRYRITITVSNGIGHKATRTVTIRIR